MVKVRKSVIAIACLVVTVIFLVVFEIGIRMLAGAQLVSVPSPPSAAEKAYYDGRHPVLGVWRHPNSSVEFSTPCMSALYETNSIGARDIESPLRADEPRAIVLGDSFIDGWGVQFEGRLSSVLTELSGVAHLNFGMSHFSPYQSFLAYEHLAKEFSHDLVLIGILPGNDMNDLDIEAAENSGLYSYRYRPYLVGKYPDYEERLILERPVTRFLRTSFYSYSVLDRFINPPVLGQGYLSPQENEDGLKNSYFYEYSEKQYRLLQRSLELLVKAAEGRPVIAFLIPNALDFVRYYESGIGHLVQRLAREPGLAGIQFIDLTPEMFRRSRGDVGKYFFACDYHWNSVGNRVAAEILWKKTAAKYERLLTPAASPRSR